MRVATLTSVSDATVDPFSSAFGLAVGGSAAGAAESTRLSSAAGNLLRKAFDCLNTDEARARRLVERALALPYDEHEQTVPAVWEAFMLLHEVVLDELESSVPEEHGWLDAAADVLARHTGPGADALRGVLDFDRSAVELTPAEAQRCRELNRGTTEDTWFDASPGEVTAETVLDVLRVAAAFQEALEVGHG